MREACGGRASARCEAPRPYFHSCPWGWAGGGAAPSARSTPTLSTRAQRDVGKDTPKKITY
ncbi:MAG: hypothetical protein NZ455_06380 [Bacteroidia bacterium]|nr:hypothetical protein [Bacteroidia bacterium]MDW8346257.1 hypothetical protein [Bacteroidia bacterium]